MATKDRLTAYLEHGFAGGDENVADGISPLDEPFIQDYNVVDLRSGAGHCHTQHLGDAASAL